MPRREPIVGPWRKPGGCYWCGKALGKVSVRVFEYMLCCACAEHVAEEIQYEAQFTGEGDDA